MVKILGGKDVAFGVGGANVNSCSEFVSELVQKSKVNTQGNILPQTSMSESVTVTVT